MDDVIFYARKQDTVDRLIDGLKKMSRGEYIMTGYGADVGDLISWPTAERTKEADHDGSC